MMAPAIRAAVYARVSTLDQEPENQLQELRRYVEARDWTAQEYTDHGVSGAKDRRPALDRLVTDAKRRRFDVLVVWRLDRLGRNLRECEAESVALLCCAALDLPGVAECRGYIQRWWGQGHEIPERSAQRILKTADQILKAGTTDAGGRS